MVWPETMNLICYKASCGVGSTGAGSGVIVGSFG